MTAGLMRLSEWSDDQYQQFETYSFLNGGTPNQKLQSVVGTMTDLSFSYSDSDFPWAVTQIVDNQAQSTKTLSYDEDGILNIQSVNGYNTTHTYNAQGLVKEVNQLFSNRQWKYNHEVATATIQATTGTWPFITTTTELVGNLYERFDNSYFTTDYRYHFFGPQRIARTIVANNDINYYHADERGSVRYVTDNQGTVTANFDYKPYGDEFTSSGSSTFRFNDRRDEGYDQLRFPLRMLNKTTYHWTALDPKVLTQPSVLLSDGANPFSYCMYDPMNRTDADGGGGVPWGMLWEIMKGMDDSEKEAVAMDRLTDLAFKAAIQTLGEAAANFAVGAVDATLATVDALSSYDQSFNREVVHIQLCIALGVPISPESTGQMLLRLSGSLAPSAVLGMTLLRPSVLSGANISSKTGQAIPGKGISPAPGTRVRPPKVPKSWKATSAKKGGVKYSNPKNPHDNIRVMQGNPRSKFQNSKQPYVRVQENGHSVDIHGNTVPSNSAEAHIPLDSF